MNFTTPGYEDLELSTQAVIREALNRGYKVDVPDRQDNFILITGKRRKEFIKQATRTSKDNYMAPLIMENKSVTKFVLGEHGIITPPGRPYGTQAKIESEYEKHAVQDIVVKPNSTNFGCGITILKTGFSRKAFMQAVRTAFEHDQTVIIEEFIRGLEYRFLIIGGFTRAVLHRVPANITGNGKNTISELINIKNMNPLRGTGYRTTLEKITLGDTETAFLFGRGLSPAFVPAEGQKVFLRKNSNISTGGDSIDFTDTMPGTYKKIAEKAAGAVGAQICGVDMIVPELEAAPYRPGYSIIELNFNPALHIHDYPFQGQNRQVEKYVLDMLNLV